MEKNLVKMTIVSRGKEQVASDGRKYFSALISPGFGQKNVTYNFWEQYIRDSAGLNTPAKRWERATPEQADALIASGESFLAEKVTAKVEAYTIGEGEKARLVDTYSTIVFPDQKAESVFASANHPMLDLTTGELIGAKKPAILSESKKVGEEKSLETSKVEGVKVEA